jgi:HemK-like putative methylase
MPRLSLSSFNHSYANGRLLSQLLKATGNVQSARNELRWLREHAIKTTHAEQGSQKTGTDQAWTSEPCAGSKWYHALEKMVQKRATGFPLQYIIGTEYFGEIEVACEEGVFIPRSDTAQAISYLAHRLDGAFPSTATSGIDSKIVDLCTGTGAIPLLFQYKLLGDSKTISEHRLSTIGIDMNSRAVRLALNNKERVLHGSGGETLNAAQRRSIENTQFMQSDVLEKDQLVHRLAVAGFPTADILLCNPPYISPSSFETTTAQSVKNFEPKLALVPPHPSVASPNINPGDTFYPVLISLAASLDVKLLWCEVEDEQQALRVVEMITRAANMSDVAGQVNDSIEIWREELDSTNSVNNAISWADHFNNASQKRSGIQVIGIGNTRSVVWWRKLNS